jgi:CBS domain-containing protein
MKKREAVSNIMKRDLWTLDVNQSNLSEAKSIMEEKKIRHLPVVKGDKLVGMISLTDIHRISFGANYNQAEQVDSAIFNSLKLEQVMKSDPTTINSNTTIKEVAETLAKEEFHALPVVDDSNKLEGIVTTTDLVNYLIDQY